MKKLFLFTLLLVYSLLAACWTSAANFVWVTGNALVTEESQITANSMESAQFTPANLILPDDKGYGTGQYIFHVSWTDPLPAQEDPYLQIHLNAPQSSFIYRMVSSEWTGTFDTPSHMVLMATNTPDDEASWEEVKDLADIITEMAHPIIYTSPVVELEKAYTDFRFVVKATVNNRHSSSGSLLFSLGRFQLYEAIKKEDSKTKLSVLLDSITALNLDFQAGTDPGFFPEKEIVNYITAYETASFALDADYDEEEYASMLNDLRSSFQTVQQAMVPITEGYYYIVNGLPGFEESQGVSKSMYAQADGILYWGNLDMDNPKHLFKITPKENGTFTIQNVGNNYYVAKKNDNGVVTMTEEPTVDQVFSFLKNAPQFLITNVDDEVPYHANNHSNGKGMGSALTEWSAGSNSPSAWILRRLTDEDKIEELLAAAPSQFLTEKLNIYIRSTQAIRSMANDYDGLITDGANLTANSVQSEQFSPANLIRPESDGYGTGQYIFHTSWSDPLPATEWPWLQVHLTSPVSEFTFRMISSEWSSTFDTPREMEIMATNTPDDEDSWVSVAVLSDIVTEIVHPIKYTSPVIEMSKEYTDLRFVVKATVNNRLAGTGMFYLSLGRFQVMSTTPSESSEYYQVEGMKEACDAYDAYLITLKQKMADGTATLADGEALLAAAEKIQTLYVDRDALDAALAAALVDAQKAYDAAVPTVEPLLVTGSQLSANSVQSDQFTPANLIRPESDGFGTNQYIFHTSWADPLPATEYPWLQVHLNAPVSEFSFRMISSEWNLTFDTPKDMEIMATNTPDDEDSWVSVTELNDMVTEIAHPVRYTSPNIELPKEYTDLRFVVKATINNRLSSTGMFYFSLGRFQMYSGINPDRVQYNYNQEVKEAADALKALIDADMNLGTHQARQEDINALNEAVAKLLEAYVDTTEMAALYSRLKTEVANTYVGTVPGTLDSEESLEAFAQAVEQAHALVNTVQPKKTEVAVAIEQMQKAHTDMMGHMNKIEPNKWYYIISNSTLNYCKEKAIYLQKTSTGSGINFGLYDADAEVSTYEGNAMAIWRFVPIEGSDYYALQNMATSHYFGPTLGKGRDFPIAITDNPEPYRIEYIGRGQINFISMDEANPDGLQVHAQESGSQIVAWPTPIDGAASWTVAEVDANEGAFFTAKDNSLQIITLPYDVPAGESLMSLNDNVKTYAIKSLSTSDDATTIELTLQDEIKAGVPFFMTVGDYQNYQEDNEPTSIWTIVPSQISTATAEANGLVGTLNGLTLTKSGLGYANGQLSVTDGQSVDIPGLSGYIDPSKVKTAEGNTDLVVVLKGGLINSIQTTVLPMSRVNVYTIDGRMVKQGVSDRQALKGLNKGIYIIGKQKVSVK